MLASMEPRQMTGQSLTSDGLTRSLRPSKRQFTPFRRSSVPHGPTPTSRTCPAAKQLCHSPATQRAEPRGRHTQPKERGLRTRSRLRAGTSAAASNETTDVVIVGGGLAGLAAGVALQKAGTPFNSSRLSLTHHKGLCQAQACVGALNPGARLPAHGLTARFPPRRCAAVGIFRASGFRVSLNPCVAWTVRRPDSLTAEALSRARLCRT